MPGAGRTHGPPATKKAGGSHHRQGQNIRHSLRDGFTAYTCAPRSPGLLASVALRISACRTRRADIAKPQDLIPASGDQDYTISPSGRMPSSTRQARCTSRRPPHPFLNARDDRETPLWVRMGRRETTTYF